MEREDCVYNNPDISSLAFQEDRSIAKLTFQVYKFNSLIKSSSSSENARHLYTFL